MAKRGRPKKVKEDPNEQLGKAIYSGAFLNKNIEHPKVKKHRLKFFDWLQNKINTWT
tara:strand:+ start:132 stop:302 length:171 start_codon:yes stop_codon:yes gene_type:complete